MDDVQQGIVELIQVTPIMVNVHRNEYARKLFVEHNTIPVDKNKYKSIYDKVLLSLQNKGFKILIA